MRNNSLRSSSTILYWASKIILHIHSDAVYPVATGARPREAGYLYLGNDTNNKQIINVAKIIKGVMMSSAVEAEIIGTLYIIWTQVNYYH